MHEISYCAETQAATWDEAYYPPTSTSGFHSYMYLYLSFVDKDNSGNLLEHHDAFTVPYNAVAWMQAQFGATSAPAPAPKALLPLIDPYGVV
jgi:hypothetical protein